MNCLYNPRKTVETGRLLFSVVEARKGGGRKAKSIEIGAAWPHEDGKGYNLVLNAFPIKGQIALRVNEPRPKEKE